MDRLTKIVYAIGFSMFIVIAYGMVVALMGDNSALRFSLAGGLIAGVCAMVGGVLENRCKERKQ